MLRAQARVDLGAIERNAARLAAVAAPAALCAVVKADGYGHGMVPAARAAQAGGASWLAVATAEEARGLRADGIEGPVLVMGALSREELEVALAARADVVAWREGFVARLAPRHCARARQARHRHGAARHARPRRGDARGRGGRGPRRPAARGGDDPLRHRPTTTRPSSPSSSRGSRRGPRRSRPLTRTCSCTPPTRPRRCASPRHASTSSAAGSRSTAWTRSTRIPPRTASSPRCRWSPTSPRPRPPRPGRAPATGAASSPRSRPASARCRSATATACAAG